MEDFVTGLRGRLALSLLQETRDKDECSPGRPVTIVAGNESCDLDSAVSAIVFAYFLHTREILKERLIVPVLNVGADDLPLKTDVCNVLLTLGLHAADIPRLEEIDFRTLRQHGLLTLILVDHHNLFDPQLEDCLSEIVDHRPVSAMLPKSCQGDDPQAKVTIKPVGSCATLVLKRIWEINPDFKDTDALRLIRFAIVTDTVNFSDEAKKTTQDDIDVIGRIDLLLGLDTLSRTVDYQLVMAAKTDISGLTSTQLLRKDMKIVKSEDGSQSLAMSSLMMSSSDLILKENFEADASAFLADIGCHGLVVMGMVITKGQNKQEKVERNLAIFPIASDNQLTDAILKKLPQFEELKLQDCNTNAANIRIFGQGDVSYSRKKVMPIIKDIINAI